MQDLSFSPAVFEEAAQLAALINSAYRGESSRQGWTTEADLIDGLRTDIVMIQDLIVMADSMLLLCKQDRELLGSVHLQFCGDEVQIGMLAVRPSLQGRGIGKQLLRAAETAARGAWRFRRFVMSVIPCRLELIAFYERRGYRRTGISKAFPANPALWTPKVTGLSLEVLEKPADQNDVVSRISQSGE